MLSRFYAWLDSRLKLEPVKETLLDEPIPGGASWIYVFGSATLFVFFLQAITGMFLAVYYAPTPDHAYDSIRYIETQVLFGPFVRGLHHWGASAMVVAIGLHMLQVFLYGAYKPPRELMWMVGVLLLLLTMGFAFTGYLLPWDQNAYWATQVGINMVGSVPFVGTFLVKVMRGGDTLGASSPCRNGTSSSTTSSSSTWRGPSWGRSPRGHSPAPSLRCCWRCRSWTLITSGSPRPGRS